MNPNQVRDLLVAERVRKGLTQREVARRLRHVPSSVSQFESGRRGFSFTALESYAAAIGVRLVVTIEEVEQ